LAHHGPDHVRRVLRRAVGLTATELVNRMRLDHAAAALRMAEKPVLAIAQEVGMPHAGHFYRCFRARFGLAPAAYRRRQRLPVRGDEEGEKASS
jgi:AraC family cel operon transcriptional repressor